MVLVDKGLVLMRPATGVVDLGGTRPRLAVADMPAAACRCVVPPPPRTVVGLPMDKTPLSLAGTLCCQTLDLCRVKTTEMLHKLKTRMPAREMTLNVAVVVLRRGFFKCGILWYGDCGGGRWLGLA
jgi:hypothetical protein